MSGEEKEGEGKVGMKKQLGLMNGVTLIVGSIVGSGIFISPMGVYKHAGSVGVALVIWIVSGIISMFGAICFAELGTIVTGSGADYAYIREAFGPIPAFMRLWVALIVIRPTLQAIVSLTFAQYIVKPFYLTCEPPNESVVLMAALCLLILTFVNCASVKAATRVQDFFTFGKIGALIIIIASGVYYMADSGLSNLDNMFSTTPTVGGVSLGLYSGLFAFFGWSFLNFVTAELKHPYRDLPRSIMIGLPIVTIIYVLTNVAYFAVVSEMELLSTPAVGITYGDKLFGKWVFVIPIFVAMSTFGTVNGIIFTSARLFHTGAMDGQLPEFFTYLHYKANTPIPSLIFTCVLSILMLVGADIYALINYVSVVLWLGVGVAVAGLLILRRKNPERPLKINIVFPLVFLVFCTFLVVFPAISSPFDVGMGLVFTATGLPMYFVMQYSKKLDDKHPLSKFSNSFNRFLRKLMAVAPPQTMDPLLEKEQKEKT